MVREREGEREEVTWLAHGQYWSATGHATHRLGGHQEKVPVWNSNLSRDKQTKQITELTNLEANSHHTIHMQYVLVVRLCRIGQTVKTLYCAWLQLDLTQLGPFTFCAVIHNVTANWVGHCVCHLHLLSDLRGIHVSNDALKWLIVANYHCFLLQTRVISSSSFKNIEVIPQTPVLMLTLRKGLTQNKSGWTTTWNDTVETVC